MAIAFLLITVLLYVFFESMNYSYWSRTISNAEARWESSQIKSYKLMGQANWGWHEHKFEVIVEDGKIVNSKCELGYDTQYGADYCTSYFNTSAHLAPALFDRARKLLKFGKEIAPREACFSADFDQDNGFPRKIYFDCNNADDEQEVWEITFIEEVH